MKTIFSILVVCLICLSLNAQDIEFTFDNAQITNDGSNDFYEVDVFISSSLDFKLGSGQLYFNYDTIAFGENIQTSGTMEFLRPDGSILAAQIGSPPFVFNIYKDFIQNDNTTSRVSISFQQSIAAQFIPADNVTTTPALLFSLKIQYQDTAQDPMFCFEDQSPFDDQFFTACANDGSDASADCTDFPGIQLLNDSFECSGAAISFSCVATTTYIGGDWDNGDPNSSTHAIVAEDYNTSINNIEACTLTVLSGVTLSIGLGEFIEIQGDITVEGTLTVAHEGTVVQVSEDASCVNNGSITVIKTSPDLTPTDFMILGSPMTSETREGVYGTGRRVLNHITENFIPNPDVEFLAPGTANWADDNGDNWAIHTGLVNPGEGYFVRPQSDQSTGGVFNLDYTQGTLNSGEVSFDIVYNGTQNGSPNIMGNPYSSAIDADLFIADNPMINEVYFWEHITAPSSSYPGYQPNNFDMGDISVYSSGSGGVAAANGVDIPSKYIASGQGFGVKATSAGTANFNNAMRVTTPNDNYRNNSDRQQIWLEVFNDTYGLGSTMLVAFTKGASNNFEGFYDSKRLATPVSLYSILDSEQELAIQGRTPFNDSQIVTLGFSTMVQETQKYTISIRNIIGDLILDSYVYLEDTVLKRWVNLSKENYSFISNNITANDRFVLHFKDKNTLKSKDNTLLGISIYPVPAKNQFTIVNSNSLALNKASIYDLSGRIIKITELNNAQLETIINIEALASASYLLIIEGNNGQITKRIIKE